MADPCECEKPVAGKLNLFCATCGGYLPSTMERGQPATTADLLALADCMAQRLAEYLYDPELAHTDGARKAYADARWALEAALVCGEVPAGVATVAPVSVMSAAFLWTNQRKDEKNGQPFTYRDLEDAFEAGAASSVPASNFKHCEQCTGWHARCRETKQCQIACGVQEVPKC